MSPFCWEEQELISRDTLGPSPAQASRLRIYRTRLTDLSSSSLSPLYVSLPTIWCPGNSEVLVLLPKLVLLVTCCVSPATSRPWSCSSLDALVDVRGNFLCFSRFSVASLVPEAQLVELGGVGEKRFFILPPAHHYYLSHHFIIRKIKSSGGTSGLPKVTQMVMWDC